MLATSLVSGDESDSGGLLKPRDGTGAGTPRKGSLGGDLRRERLGAESARLKAVREGEAVRGSEMVAEVDSGGTGSS